MSKPAAQAEQLSYEPQPESNVYVADNDKDLETAPKVDAVGAFQEKVLDDEAAPYLDSSLVIDEAENKRLRWIIHKRILSLMCLAYITQGLDKGTISPLSIMGWLDDIHAKGQDFANISSMMWLGIIAGEPIAGQLIRRLPVAKVLAGSMVIWTALAWGMAFSPSVAVVMANRFLLGFFESTFGPCLMTITVQWYRIEEQPYISAIWQSTNALSIGINSLMGWGFYQVPRGGTLHGWQYLCLVVAALSSISTVVVFFFMPDTPAQAKWASSQKKTQFLERVRGNNQGVRQKHWNKEHAWEAVKDPFSYLLFSMAFIQTIVVGGISKFTSLLLNKAFGFDVLTSQLLKIPMAFVGVSFYFLLAYIIHKFNNTLYLMVVYTLVAVAGTIVLVTVAPGDSTRVGLFIAFVFMQCFASVNTAIFSLMSRNVAGQTKKSIVYASAYMAWGAGNALSSQLFWNTWAPRYINSLYIHLGLYALLIMLALFTRWMLVRRNKAKDDGQRAADGTIVNLHSHAFEDLTDLKNPDFRYSL